jgi:hypothetical protein
LSIFNNFFFNYKNIEKLYFFLLMFKEKNFLNYLTLSFKEKKNEESFEEETKFRTVMFIRFFLFYVVIINYLGYVVDYFMMNPIRKLVSICL